MRKTFFFIDFLLWPMRVVGSAIFNRHFYEKLVLSDVVQAITVREGVGVELTKQFENRLESDLFVCCRRWQMLCALVWDLKRC